MLYKKFMIEKEALTPVNDSKVDRDHKRHFLMTRVLGHELDIPGSSEWEACNESA